MNGYIIYLNRERGFGHVRADGEAGVELFFHYSDLIDEAIGDFGLGHHVSFVPIMTRRGPAAADVRHRVLHGTVVMLRIGTSGQPGYGYAFVAPDCGGEDLFVHHTRMAAAGLAPGEQFAALKKGDRVQYRECRGRMGQRDRAIDVRPLAPRPAEGPWRPQFINHTPLQEPTMIASNTLTDAQDDMHTDRREGAIVRIVADRGFGFIKQDNAKGRDGIFFHFTSLPPGAFDTLQGRERVTYVEGVGRDGRPCATAVRLLDALRSPRRACIGSTRECPMQQLRHVYGPLCTSSNSGVCTMTTANYQDRGGSIDEDATTELPHPLWDASGDTAGAYAIRLPDDLAQHIGGDLPVGSMSQEEHDALWPDLARTRARTRGAAGEGA